MGVIFNSKFIRVPGGIGDTLFEVFDLEPILYVYSQQDSRVAWFHCLGCQGFVESGSPHFASLHSAPPFELHEDTRCNALEIHLNLTTINLLRRMPNVKT